MLPRSVRGADCVVSAENPLPVRLVQGIRDNGNSQCLIEWQRSLLQPLGQRLSVEILHDQEVHPVLAPDVVESADVRMVQAGDRLGLALEPLLQIRVRGDLLRQALDGDGAVEAGVAGFVDLAHAACAQGGVDLVGAKRRASF